MRIGVMEISARQGHEAGRELLARLYQEYTGKAMPEIVKTEQGKPYFQGDPLHFSISHTKRHVFCALSERNVGLDAEEMDRAIDLRLADKILSPEEKRRYEKAGDKRVALLKLWVLKEAYAKLTGLGLQGYLNHTDFDPDDPRVIVKDNCYLAILEDIKWSDDHVI